MIQATSLTKRFGGLTAVSDVSFRIYPGEVVGLLGPNGAGKTTTMRILSGFMPPTEGTVTISGVDILTEPKKAKKMIGYLPEVPPLYPELTVEESLRFVAELHQAKPLNSKIDAALEKTGLTAIRNRLVQKLSRGFRQRLGIAQAIVHEPDVLILDEPTVGLDPKQIREIRELIQNLRGRQAIIFSSHILQEVHAVCDRVIIIHQGRIVADGNVKELTGNSRKRFLVTAHDGGNGMKESLERLPGVAEVAEYVSGLEELFLKMTEEKEATDVASH